MKFAAVCFLTIVSLSVHAEGKLNLKQKKLMNDPSLKANIAEELEEINKSCGCKPEVDMDWTTVASQDDALLARKAASHVKYEMQSLCKQNLKTEACKIKKIQVKKGSDSMESKASYKSGVITLEAGGGSNWGMPAIDKLLEENL